MKFLLTSSGISNPSISKALVELLGKPIAECDALFIPTAIYPFPRGAYMASQAIRGKAASPLCELGWKSLGVLELTALPSIDKNVWVQAVEDADALLVWGGDVLYLAYWMQQSGFTDVLMSLQRELVYVGVSAGSMAVSSTIGEACTNPPTSTNSALSSEDVVFGSPKGEIKRTFVTAQGAGFVDFAIIPHLDNENHPDASSENAEQWAAKLPVPVYAIDDQTAIAVSGGRVDVVSEGQWQRFNS